MFLHEDRELFEDVIKATAESQHRPAAIVEKDYYVTKEELLYLSVIMQLIVFQKILISLFQII